MTTCLLIKTDPEKFTARFYRVEICANLFEEFSVLREWGMRGGKGRQVLNLFPDLISASLAADRLRNAKLRAGYNREPRS